VFPGTKSWYEPYETSIVDIDGSDPLAHQVDHFAAVIRGGATPICSARDGLNTLWVVDAVIQATRSGESVDLTE